MKCYTIIGGVNGTGKSSLLGVLATMVDTGTVIDDTDIEECLAKNLSFTQETTLSGRKTEVTAARAREQGYYVRLYYVGLDTPDECLARIANRVRRGGHDIPENDVLRRFEGRWDAVEKILPYCDEAHFFDNDNGFVEVAEYRNGELQLKGERLPAWIAELSERLKD